MQVSLILATLGRDVEVIRYLNSLTAQSYRNFELVIIDQNKDGKIDNIIHQFIHLFSIRHIKVDFVGLAKARDYGIQFAHGNIIAFPDDDCVYEVDVLEKVIKEFEKQKEISILAVGSYDFDKVKFSIGVNAHNPRNFSKFLMMGIEFTHFFNLDKININDFYFDYDFGLGAKYPSMEGFELMYRLLLSGNKAFYTPKIRIYHANKRAEDYHVGGDRIFVSSFAMGAFIRKFTQNGDIFMIYFILRKMIIAPVIKIIMAIFMLNQKKIHYEYKNLLNTWHGFISYSQ